MRLYNAKAAWRAPACAYPRSMALCMNRSGPGGGILSNSLRAARVVHDAAERGDGGEEKVAHGLQAGARGCVADDEIAVDLLEHARAQARTALPDHAGAMYREQWLFGKPPWSRR
jgi:hypothetical protein